MSEADVLVHLVDITHPNAEEQYSTVERTLADLGLADKPRVVAFNKIDRLAPLDRASDELQRIEDALRQEHPEAVLISAAQKWNLDALLQAVEAELSALAEAR